MVTKRPRNLHLLGGLDSEKDQKSIDAIESDPVSEPSLIIDDNIIEELPDGCSGPVV